MTPFTIDLVDVEKAEVMKVMNEMAATIENEVSSGVSDSFREKYMFDFYIQVMLRTVNGLTFHEEGEEENKH